MYIHPNPYNQASKPESHNNLGLSYLEMMETTGVMYRREYLGNVSWGVPP